MDGSPSQLTNSSGWRSEAMGPFMLMLLTALQCSAFLQPDQILLLPDLYSLEIPGYRFYRESLLNGALPLWTPYSGCGEPYLAGSDIGVFYPANLVFLLLPIQLAIAVFAYGHLLVGALATWWLMRAWRISRSGSLLAATAFTWSSWIVARLEFLPTLASVVWFPICLALLTCWLSSRRSRWLLWLCGALAMSVLAGWPEGSFFIGSSLAIYAIIAGIGDAGQQGCVKAGVRPLAAVLTCGVVAILLAAVQIVPTWEAVSLSQRAAEFDAGTGDASVDWLMLLGLLFPSVYGLPTARFRGEYWAPTCSEFYHGTMYIGMVPLVVLLAAGLIWLTGLRRKKDTAKIHSESPVTVDPHLPPHASNVRTPVVICLTILALLYAMGNHTPVFPFLWRAIPVIQKFHGPAKALMVFVLGLACLAGIGWDALSRASMDCARESRRAQRIVTGLLGLVLVGLATAVVMTLVDGGEPARGVYRRLSGVTVPDDQMPWGILGFEVARSAVIGALATVSVMVLLCRGRMQTTAFRALFVLLLCDLWFVGQPLIITGQVEQVELDSPSELLSELQSEDRPFRFLRPIRGHELYGETEERLFRRARGTLRGWWSTVDRAYGLNQAGPFRARNVSQVLDRIRDPQADPSVRQRLLAMLNCEREIIPMAEGAYVTGWADNLPIRKLGPSLPRAIVVAGLEPLEEDDAIIERLESEEFDPLSSALVRREELQRTGLDALQVGAVAHEILKLQDGRNRLDVDVLSDRNAFLVVSDACYPGWTAQVDGVEVPIVEVNGAFRAVPIAAGESHVTFVYRPLSLRVGAAVSGLTLVGLVLAAFGAYRRSSRKT